MKKFPQIVVYGPQETQDKGTTQVVKDGETAFVLGHEFSVIATPGHTLGHICYFSKPYLFCGDTLFSGGCGRLFEGTPSQMYQSLKKLSALPDDTLVCCAHEYTLSNLNFSQFIEPNNPAIAQAIAHDSELRQQNEPTLPTSLADEKAINPFMRAVIAPSDEMINTIQTQTGIEDDSPFEIFRALRQLKNNF